MLNSDHDAVEKKTKVKNMTLTCPFRQFKNAILFLEYCGTYVDLSVLAHPNTNIHKRMVHATHGTLH